MDIDLGEIRQEIDKIDEEFVRLFEKRMALSEEVARYKIGSGMPVYDPVREKKVIEEARKMAGNEFNAKGVEALFNQIMSVSRIRQYELTAESAHDSFGFSETEPDFDSDGIKVVYQGVEGAYGHQAVCQFFGYGTDMYHVSTFEDVMCEVSEGRADFGVLPVENSSTGIIEDVYDLMNVYDNYIAAECVVKVTHALLGLHNSDINQIKTVYSHPQGLLQCGSFLATRPEWEQVGLKNTAVSAKKVYTDQDVTQAAIASPEAAKYYDLKVLKDNISDNGNNSTRFIIISNKKEFVRGADGISISFELAHETGSLYHILGFVIYNGLNMTKIESRPIPGEKWRYRFYIDLDGNLGDIAVRDALKSIEQEAGNFKILGSYIQAE